MEMRKNILSMSLKGGCAKTSTSSMIASFIQDPKPLLIEVDKINQSDEKINKRDYYNSVQLDWMDYTNSAFEEFQDLLLQDGIKVIDVGAVKLETFHQSMVESGAYQLIDLLIVTSMDGADDFRVGLETLDNLQEFVDIKNKCLISLNRWNKHTYSVEDQFDSWFDNAEVILQNYGLDIVKNHFVIEDSYAVKKARKVGETVRYFYEMNPKEITEKVFSEKNDEKRKELNRLKNVVSKAHEVYPRSIAPALLKIFDKLGLGEEVQKDK